MSSFINNMYKDAYCPTMATKGTKCCSRTLPPDVLSNLPENLIDDILVRLPLRDAVRTSILSKKWRYNWCRLPKLTLDETFWKTIKHLARFKRKFTEIPSKKSYFTEVIHHVLTLHAGTSAKLTLCIPSLEICRVIDDNFIHFLSRRNVQHLVLKLLIDRYPHYKLPPSLFTNLQLRYLTLHKCSILPPLSFEGFDRLISLKLRDVTISSVLLECFLSHCLLLEQLVLEIPCYLTDIIEINAPKLRSFKFEGNLRSLCLKNIPLLAKLSLRHNEYFFRAKRWDIAKFFEPFSALEHLNFDFDELCFAAEEGDSLTRLPYNLNCVKHLCISSIILGILDYVSCALCLIRSFPYLQYLEIKVADRANKNIDALECLGVERLSDVTFNHLSEVKLIITIGTVHEMQLIKLLLAKSPVLVRMLIKPSRLIKDSATVKVLTELTKFQRASPKAEVIYKPDKHPCKRSV